MADPVIHKGDIGTKFIIEVVDEDGNVLDISGASAMAILFKKHDRTVVSETAVHLTDGTDGKMVYTAEDGFLDQVGQWSMQGKVTLTDPAGTWFSTVKEFLVHDALEVTS